MLRRVPKRRSLVAAPNMSAGATQPQVYPLHAELQTLFAALGARVHFADAGSMRTTVCHRISQAVQTIITALNQGPVPLGSARDRANAMQQRQRARRLRWHHIEESPGAHDERRHHHSRMGERQTLGLSRTQKARATRSDGFERRGAPRVRAARSRFPGLRAGSGVERPPANGSTLGHPSTSSARPDHRKITTGSRAIRCSRPQKTFIKNLRECLPSSYLCKRTQGGLRSSTGRASALAISASGTGGRCSPSSSPPRRGTHGRSRRGSGPR